MPVKIRYQGAFYQVENGHWRGPDGHTVHFLTWVSDDLRRMGTITPESDDAEIAARVVEQIGEPPS